MPFQARFCLRLRGRGRRLDGVGITLLPTGTRESVLGSDPSSMSATVSSSFRKPGHSSSLGACRSQSLVHLSERGGRARDARRRRSIRRASSVPEAGSPRAPRRCRPGARVRHLLRTAAMAEQLGGKVESGHYASSPSHALGGAGGSLFEGVWATGERHQVWMSRRPGDEAPSGSASSPRREPPSPVADEAVIYSVQFHPRSCTRRTAPS